MVEMSTKPPLSIWSSRALWYRFFEFSKLRFFLRTLSLAKRLVKLSVVSSSLAVLSVSKTSNVFDDKYEEFLIEVKVTF